MTLPDANAAGSTRRGLIVLSGGAALGVALGAGAANAATASELDRTGAAALARLYQASTRSKEFGKLSKGILVFPRIYKAGFMVGGMGGEGVLMERGKANTYYSIGGASFGLQAGGQGYSYALFFLRQSALDYLKSSEGWAIGSGPTVVIADKGFTKSADTTTLTQDVYAVPFGAKGLMAGLGLQGTKITHIHPKP